MDLILGKCWINIFCWLGSTTYPNSIHFVDEFVVDKFWTSEIYEPFEHFWWTSPWVNGRHGRQNHQLSPFGKYQIYDTE